MKIINRLILLGLILSLIACNLQPETTDIKGSTTTNRSISDSYKPAYFEDDNRAEKIKEIEPEIQRLIEQHRKEKNIPGIAYGIVVDDELVVASATGLIDLKKELATTTKSSFRIASMTKSEKEDTCLISLTNRHYNPNRLIASSRIATVAVAPQRLHPASRTAIS